ncbi:hypothetical protein RN001_015398 [Aquatica leii]|uniref:Uncharacterized protein n=1 Tax=Aquatica leii TaxID=1421715 RepID=A0AAN7NZ48_9COLE|nr:hypothetical protein RN001_015398 [Aquatica leii]
MYSLIALYLLVNLSLLKTSYLDKRPSMFLPYASECMCETGVDPKKAYDYIYHLKFSNDPCFKCFVKCTLVKIGFYTSDGKVSELVSQLNAQELTQDDFNKCNNTNPDLCERLYKVSKCVVGLLRAL